MTNEKVKQNNTISSRYDARDYNLVQLSIKRLPIFIDHALSERVIDIFFLELLIYRSVNL